MFYKNILFFILFLLIANCKSTNIETNKINNSFRNSFSNKGFALIYNQDLYDQGLIEKKIDERDLILFQKNLKINTTVKITNILNNKSVIANVGKQSEYPKFNNSVISIRVAEELDLDPLEPYIEIIEILDNSIFLANKAQTYDEEKNVAIKAPVNSISINDLNKVAVTNQKKLINKFSYIIKIADFYYKDISTMMTDRIINETIIKNPKIRKITKNKYRVYLGPFDNINSLQKTYNDIRVLEFENIEIIKND